MPFGKTLGGWINEGVNAVSHPLDTASAIINAPRKAISGFGTAVERADIPGQMLNVATKPLQYGPLADAVDYYDQNLSEYNPAEGLFTPQEKAPPQNLVQSQNPFAISSDDARAISGLGGQKESFGPAGDKGEQSPSDTPEPVDISQYEDTGDVAPVQKMPVAPDSGVDVNKILGGLSLPNVGKVGAGAGGDGRMTSDQLLKMAGIETDSARDARIAKESERPDLNVGGKKFKNPEEQGISAQDQMRRYQAIANDPAFSGTPQQQAAKRALAGSDLRSRVANEQADVVKAAQAEKDALATQKTKGEIGAQEDAAKSAALDRKLKELDLKIKYATSQDEIEKLKAQGRQAIADADVASQTAGERVKAAGLGNKKTEADILEGAGRLEEMKKKTALAERAQGFTEKQADQADFKDFSKGFTSEFANLEKESRDMLNQAIKDNPTDRANIEKQVNDYRAQKYGALLQQKAAEAKKLGLSKDEVKPFLEQELRKIPGFSPSLMKQLMNGLGQGAQVLGSARSLIMPGASF